MSADAQSKQLRALFLRELTEGAGRAREALDKLRAQPADAAALAALRIFFHRIAGTAGSVGLDLLGRLAASCEGVADLCAERGQVTETAVKIFADGLAGVDEFNNVAAAEATAPRTQVVESQPTLIAVEAQASRVLVVDDDPFSARLVDSVLRAAGFASSYTCEPGRAFDIIQSERPDLIILDVVMPEEDGFNLCHRIRAAEALQLTPIIFVTRKGDVEQRVRGLQVGGNDYVAKPFEPRELVARVRSHLQRLSELREMAVRDGLTHCYNNKYFKTRIEQEMTRAQRYGNNLTLGMLDIDHFADVNKHGHPAGDAVLAHLASLLRASVRSTDVVARFGGDEFGFLLIESAVPEAAAITDRLRERIAQHSFVVPSLAGNSEVHVHCTVSIGLASFQLGDTPQMLLGRADAALLEAKNLGRNQVRVSA